MSLPKLTISLSPLPFHFLTDFFGSFFWSHMFSRRILTISSFDFLSVLAVCISTISPEHTSTFSSKYNNLSQLSEFPQLNEHWKHLIRTYIGISSCGGCCPHYSVHKFYPFCNPLTRNLLSNIYSICFSVVSFSLQQFFIKDTHHSNVFVHNICV